MRTAQRPGAIPLADNIVTDRLRKLAEVPDDDYEPTGETRDLEDMQFIETAELKQLLATDPESEIEEDLN
jgi:hypothetical protein